MRNLRRTVAAFVFWGVAAAVAGDAAAPRPEENAATPPFAGTGEHLRDKDYGLLPVGMNGTLIQIDETVKTPVGDLALRVRTPHDFDQLQWGPYIVYPAPENTLAPGAKVVIRCWAKASASLKMVWRITRNVPRSEHLSPTVTFEITPEWKEFVFEKFLSEAVDPGAVANAPRMMFPDLRQADRVWLGPLTLTVHAPDDSVSAAAPRADGILDAAVDIEQPGDWKPISTASLYIKPGSALDFSGFVDHAPAGSLGRVVADPDSGAAVFEKRPGETARFLSVQLMPTQLPAMSRKAIDEYAAAIARQGYNMVRFHYLDDILRVRLRAPALKPRPGDARPYALPEKPEDIHFDALALDRFHYLVAALKKNGVYINLDAMTSYTGYDNGHALANRQGGFHTKIQLFVNPMFRNNWKAGVGKLLRAVNPYTGLSLAEDPALALVSFLNEQDILTSLRDYSQAFKPAWTDFLKDKYGNYAALHKAWNGRCGEKDIPAADAGDFDGLPGITHAVASGSSQAGLDMSECIGRMGREMTVFYLDAIREIGYPGLATNWNMRPHLASVPARSLLAAVSMNQYHAHPTNGVAGKGAEVNPASSVKLAGNSFKSQALTRFADRPFFNTEFGFCFWNPYRHEQGLVFGAGAALQDWTAITCHAGQVIDAGGTLQPFRAGDDPVIRAAEAVAALAFLRGDVASSPHRAEIPLGDDFIFSGRALGALSDELSRLWALCRVGIVYGPKRADTRPDLVILPGPISNIGDTDMFSQVENSISTGKIEPIVARMRERGVLSKDNRTDVKAGVFQSDTGEIVLETGGEGVLTIVTPRLAGVTVKSDREYRAGSLTVRSCSAPAAVTVASLDAAAAISRANRLLVVFATDALNNGMRFKEKGEERRTLEALGGPPVLWRTARLSLDIAVEDAAGRAFHAYSLALNGERMDEIPVTVEDGAIRLDLDTARLPSGPAVFFEVERH